MGGAAMGGLLVPPKRPVADGAPAAPNRGFHHGAGMQVSDHHGHSRVRGGQFSPESPGIVALSVSTLRRSLGTSRLQKDNPPLGSARDELVTIETSSMPNVVQISFFTDPQGRSATQLLAEWPTLVDVAEAAARSGSSVSVVQCSLQKERLRRNGVNYHFTPFDDNWRELLRSLVPDVFHVHGLDFPNQVRSLAKLNPGIPIILQDHASRPPRLWRRTSARRGIAAAAGVAFCACD